MTPQVLITILIGATTSTLILLRMWMDVRKQRRILAASAEMIALMAESLSTIAVNKNAIDARSEAHATIMACAKIARKFANKPRVKKNVV